MADALNQTTSLEPDGGLRISHPDGTQEIFTYNAFGQVLSHTDGKGIDHPPANTAQPLGGRVIKPSNGTAAKLKLDTKSARSKL